MDSAQDIELYEGNHLNLAAKLFDTDNYLIERICKNKDRQAAEKLIERHYKKIYKHIFFKVKDEELAKDITQDTFIAMLRGVEKFDEAKASFKTWLLKIADNKVIDYSRSKQYHQMIVTETLEDKEIMNENDLEKDAIDGVEVDKVYDVLQSQSPENRKIFEMKAVLGYSFSEIGVQMNISAAAAKTRYYSMIKKIRKEMQDYE